MRFMILCDRVIDITKCPLTLILNEIGQKTLSKMPCIPFGLRWDFRECTEAYFGFCACIPLARIVMVLQCMKNGTLCDTL